MIQRIQSIFLLLCAGSLGSNFILPFASSANKAQQYFEDGLLSIQDNPLLIALVGLTAVLAIIDIFLYKNRPLQLKLALGLIFLIGVVIGLLGISIFNAQDITISLGTAAPIVGLIFATLSYFYIKKDDKLVKSMDRLR